MVSKSFFGPQLNSIKEGSAEKLADEREKKNRKKKTRAED